MSARKNRPGKAGTNGFDTVAHKVARQAKLLGFLAELDDVAVENLSNADLSTRLAELAAAGF